MVIYSNIKDLPQSLKRAVEHIDYIIKPNKLHIINFYKSKSKSNKILVGYYNGASDGRSDFSSPLISAAIRKAMKIPTFPKDVEFDHTNKGLTLSLIEPNNNIE